MNNTEKTNYYKSRTLDEGITNIVNKVNSHLEYLKYSIIYLNKRENITISLQANEAALVVLRGSAKCEINDDLTILNEHDVIYIPSGETFNIAKDHTGELMAYLFEAPAENKYKTKVIRFDETRSTTSGEGVYQRDVFLMIDNKSVEADRLILGYCWGIPGGWTGWPPHEHSDTLEELYVFYDIKDPGFALQILYDKLDDIQCLKVQEGDAVAIDSGFHPIVAVPGYRVKNVWVMSAKRAQEDRNTSLARIQEEFILTGDKND